MNLERLVIPKKESPIAPTMSTRLDGTALSPKTTTSPHQKSRNAITTTSLSILCKSPGLKKSHSIKDPSISLTERSKIYNSLFGFFFATRAFGLGYHWSVMGPLGEKYIRLHFGIIDDASLYFGFTNLAWALGGLIGSASASSISQKMGQIKILFYTEIVQALVYTCMVINNIQLFIA